MLCIGKQLVERRTGTSRDDVERQGLDVFHPGVSNFWVQSQFCGHFRQKGAFLGSRFEKRDPGPVTQEFSQNQTWKPSTTPEVSNSLHVIGDELDELRTIPNVAPPNLGKRAGRNKILARVPAFEYFGIDH